MSDFLRISLSEYRTLMLEGRCFVQVSNDEAENGMTGREFSLCYEFPRKSPDSIPKISFIKARCLFAQKDRSGEWCMLYFVRKSEFFSRFFKRQE